MTIQECYARALQKAELNLANGGDKLDLPRFVLLFNEQQNRYVRYALKKKNVDDIRYIQKLIVYNKKLNKLQAFTNPESYLYGIPNDFFDFVSISGSFKKGSCVSSDFGLWEIHHEDINELLMDENNKPSYDYRETFYTIGHDGINVYTGGFDVTRINLTYYRYPKEVDIAGYVRVDGSASSDIDPELDDKVVLMILDMVEKQHALNEGDGRYNLDLNNVTSLK